jgi:hypothetical protein
MRVQVRTQLMRDGLATSRVREGVVNNDPSSEATAVEIDYTNEGPIEDLRIVLYCNAIMSE